jgi:hypothetical protein
LGLCAGCRWGGPPPVTLFLSKDIELLSERKEGMTETVIAEYKFLLLVTNFPFQSKGIQFQSKRFL